MAGTSANVAGIELQVEDLERAEAFYTAVLGLAVRARPMDEYVADRAEDLRLRGARCGAF